MIKGIDAQVMIQRSVEYARQSAEQVNSAQQAQEFLNRLEKEQAQQNLSTVLKSERAEQGKVNADGRSQNGREGQKEQKKEEKKTEQREILDDVSKLEAGYVPKSRVDLEI